jgi:glycosyltransferase involved in cell wall biosynthesis
MTEIIEDGRTGLLFEPGDPDDLAAKVNWAMEHPAEMRAMGQNARELYLQNFTARHNYDRLMEIYGAARGPAADPVRPGVA